MSDYRRQQELESEWNAQYDEISERFASEREDMKNEGLNAELEEKELTYAELINLGKGLFKLKFGTDEFNGRLNSFEDRLKWLIGKDNWEQWEREMYEPLYPYEDMIWRGINQAQRAIRNSQPVRGKDWNGDVQTLLDAPTGEAVYVGDYRECHNSGMVKVTGGRAPHKPSSQGFVWVLESGVNSDVDLETSNCVETMEYYAGVVDACWTKGEYE